MAIYIGTSGFSYHHWSLKFYPKEIKQADWLKYYAKFFNSVELNVSFYRLPDEGTFEKWCKSTPVDFVFVIKGSRYITHIKRLKVEKASIDIFMKRAELLQKKLHVVLWQLPPRMKKDIVRLETFLKLINRYKYRFVFELRNESWFSQDVYDVLKKYNAALVVADSPRFPRADVQTADFSYLRFHGGKYLYSSKYSPKEMKDWSKKIVKLAGNGDVYAYFNNDANAFAVKNSLELKKLIEEKHVKHK